MLGLAKTIHTYIYTVYVRFLIYARVGQNHTYIRLYGVYTVFNLW